MVTKNKTTQAKSSKKLANFLAKTGLHKKDFAQMVGVTLSYVYNLIDESIPFFNTKCDFRKNCGRNGYSTRRIS